MRNTQHHADGIAGQPCNFYETITSTQRAGLQARSVGGNDAFERFGVNRHRDAHVIG